MKKVSLIFMGETFLMRNAECGIRNYGVGISNA